eukprot:2783948-Heterocapsa_arctica.AAC.1
MYFHVRFPGQLPRPIESFNEGSRCPSGLKVKHPHRILKAGAQSLPAIITLMLYSGEVSTNELAARVKKN